MDERDLDLAVPLGAPLDERQGGEDSFSVGEVLARGSVACLSIHGSGSLRKGFDQGPVVVFAARGWAALVLDE